MCDTPTFFRGTLCESPTFFKGTCYRDYKTHAGRSPQTQRLLMNDLMEARRLQQGILENYDADFSKHAPERILERMRLVWKSLPGQLARENKKFLYGAVRPGGARKGL